MKRSILAILVMAIVSGSALAEDAATGFGATTTGFSSTERTAHEAFSGERTPAQEKGAHLGNQTSEAAVGTGASVSGFSSTARTAREAFTGTGDKTITGKPSLPSFSGTSPRMQTNPVASFTGNQSTPSKAPEQTVTGKAALPSFTGERQQLTVAPRASFVGNQSVPTPAAVTAPDQMKGKSIAPQITAVSEVSHPNATINVSAGSLKPDTKVNITDPATGKTKTVSAKTLSPSVQVAKPVQSAFVHTHNGNGDKSHSNNSHEHGTGSGSDNAHDHAFGGHSGAGGGFHM